MKTASVSLSYDELEIIKEVLQNFVANMAEQINEVPGYDLPAKQKEETAMVFKLGMDMASQAYFKIEDALKKFQS